MTTPPKKSGPNTAVRSVEVPEDRDNQRLDNFLSSQIKGVPKSLIYKLVRSGQVKIHIDQRYPLADVQQAHRDLEARKTTGCTILTL